MSRKPGLTPSRKPMVLPDLTQPLDPFAALGCEVQATETEAERWAAAMRDALDIREWTDGPRRAPWRVNRLAKALFHQPQRRRP